MAADSPWKGKISIVCGHDCMGCLLGNDALDCSETEFLFWGLLVTMQAAAFVRLNGIPFCQIAAVVWQRVVDVIPI